MSKYDAVIIGAGIAGLSVAARLGRKGKRVVIIDPATAVGGNSLDVSLDGLYYSPGPAACFGFEQNGPLRNLCSELGITLKFHHDKAPYQIVLPDHRITVFPDKDHTIQELSREFPREMENVRKIYRELLGVFNASKKSRVKAYLAERRSAKEFLAPFHLSRGLTAFFNVQALIFFGMPVASLRLSSLALLISTFPQTVNDGLSGLAASLGNIISGTSGTIRLGEPWPQLTGRSNIVTGVVTGSGTLEARSVIINTLEQGSERRWLIGIRPDVVPVCMRDTVVYLPDYDKPFNVMTMTMPDNTSGSAGNDLRALRVSFYGPESTTASDILLERICAIIPFLRNHLMTGGEEDLSALSYPAEKLPAHHTASRHELTLAEGCKRIKNVIFIPDRNPGLGQTVMEAHRLARG
ncbi:MAG: FAD-dependent oxidoreductase [Nitrospirota bacterium]|nr:FAD-dependent oxidoreductase [Nitrospirota bacterium]